jgi:hypothetical protein
MITGLSQEPYLLKGHNALETCVLISARSYFSRGPLMELDAVKEVLRRLNESGVRYCLIGGLALAHHSIPRATHDVNLLVLPEDMAQVQQVLKGYQQRGTAVVLIFQVGNTRIDVQPANLRAKRTAVLSAIEDVLEDLPVRVANLRDLILLKMWAVPDRPELVKRHQDETDIIGLIQFNSEKISAEDIAYICRTLLAMVYTPDEVKKYRAQIEWLNDVLDKLGLSDRRYELE